MEIGQLKRTVLNQKKWRTISKLSLLIGILLSLLFINVFALAIVSKVFPDLDIIKFKLIFLSLK
jgi:hypothetical protein